MKEHLLPTAVEADGLALGIGEADAIQRLKPHQQPPAHLVPELAQSSSGARHPSATRRIQLDDRDGHAAVR
jgi:hypothetical protein